MMLNTSERFTYKNLLLLDIKRKLFELDPNMKEPDELEISNLALIVLSLICDAHVSPELNRHEIAQNMIDDKEDFLYYVKDLIMQTNERNNVLNEYIEKHMIFNKKEVKK